MEDTATIIESLKEFNDIGVSVPIFVVLVNSFSNIVVVDLPLSNTSYNRSLLFISSAQK